MDPKVMKATQDSLGKIIKKPPLTDKLLSKPPFRFLHDIMTSIIKTTGFMKGLYTDAEMSSDNVKDKDSKMAFLQKAVDMVALVLGAQLSVRPSKVVAGHEPEKTNEFLQSLAAAINKNVNNDDFVERVLKGDKGVKESRSKEDRKDKSRERSREKLDQKEEKQSREKSSDKRKEDQENNEKGDKREKSRDKDKERQRDKERHRDKDRDQDRDKDKERDKGKERDKERGDKEKDRDRDKDKDRERHKDRENRDKDREHRDKDREHRSKKHRKEEAQKENESPEAEDEPQVNGETGEISDPPPKKAERPASAKGSRRRRDEDVAIGQLKAESSGSGTLGEDDLPPQVAEARRLARPSSARPAAPRVKNKDVVSDEPAMRLGSGRPTNVIVDNDQSDEDDNFMVEESAPPPMTIEREKTMLGGENEEEHGGLVKKILESKKEFEEGSQQAPTAQKKTEIERPTMSDAARRKEREMVQKEIDKLRGSIQTVTRSANPLGKIMDYVQEDLDAMQKELDVWKKENKEQTLALKREQSITDKAIEPLKAQLSELDQAILDQMDLIAAVKSNIIHNDQKVEKMLRSISKS